MCYNIFSTHFDLYAFFYHGNEGKPRGAITEIYVSELKHNGTGLVRFAPKPIRAPFITEMESNSPE